MTLREFICSRIGKNKKIGKNNEKGVSILVEYLIIIGILTVFMAFLVPQLSTIIGKNPALKSMSSQLSDVAGETMSKITDMILIAPKNGSVKSSINMPEKVGKYTYYEKVVNNSLTIKNNKISYTKNVNFGNVSKVTNITIENKTVFSTEQKHELKLPYTFKPTAVALAYPVNVTVGENVTFYVGNSYNAKYYKWNFGDGNITGLIDFSNCKTLYHEYSKPGDYLALLTVYSVNGTATDYVMIHVRPNDTYINNTYIKSFTSPKYVTISKNGSINPKVVNASVFMFWNLHIPPLNTTVVNVTKTIYIKKKLNVTVIHTIDASGSMNETTYYSYDNVSVNSTAVKLRLGSGDYFIFINTSDFTNFWNTYNITPINAYIQHLWFFYQLNIYKIDGTKIEKVNRPTGNSGLGCIVSTWWEEEYTIYLLDSYPLENENVNVYVYKLNVNGSNYTLGKLYKRVNTTVYKDYREYNIKMPILTNKFYAEVYPYYSYSYPVYLWVKGESLTALHSNEEYIGGYYPEYTLYVVPDKPVGVEYYVIQAGVKKIDAAKSAAQIFNGFLNASTDRVGVVEFKDDYAKLLTAPTDPYTANQSIKMIEAEGATPMAAGIKLAREELENYNSSKTVKAIILLSDGDPNIDLNGNYNVGLAIKEAIEQANIAKSENITIYTIGFGSDANKTLLREIASSPSDFYFAANGSELRDIYESLAKNVENSSYVNVTKKVNITKVITPSPINVRIILYINKDYINYITNTGDAHINRENNTVTWDLQLGYTKPIDVSIGFNISGIVNSTKSNVGTYIEIVKGGLVEYGNKSIKIGPEGIFLAPAGKPTIKIS